MPTGSNYGEVEGICTESIPLNPLFLLYGRTKTEAEAMMLMLPTLFLAFCNGIGIAPRLRLDLLINDFAGHSSKYLVVYEKHFRRTFIHVHDIARAIVHVVDSNNCQGHKVFNVGSEALNYTKEDIQ